MKSFYDRNNPCYKSVFFVFAIFEMLLCSGITFGWASIIVIFKMEYFYMDICIEFFKENNITYTRRNLTAAKSADRNLLFPDKLHGCSVQDLRFNLIFTIAAFSLALSKFPSGLFIDNFGPRKARLLGGSLYVAAAFGLVFVQKGYENFLFPVFIGICIGSSFIIISNYQMVNAIYTDFKSQVMCVLNGAFDSSAVTLLVFLLAYNEGVSFKSIALSYAIICLVCLTVGTFVLIPPKEVVFEWVTESYIASNDEEFNSHESVGSSDSPSTRNGYQSCTPTKGILSNKTVPSQFTDDEEKTALIGKSLGKSSVLPNDSIWQSIFSSLYLLEVVFLAIFKLKLWYFTGTITDYIGRLTHNDKEAVNYYVQLLGYIQLGGIIVTPFVGVIFDREQYFTRCLSPVKNLNAEQKKLRNLQQTILPFTVTNILCIILCALPLIEDLRVQIPTYVLYTIVRGFVYSNHGSYTAIAFPASQFGTLYGLGIFAAGVFGLVEYALFALSTGPFNGNPYYTNVILLILVILANVHPINLWRYCRDEEKRLHSIESM